MAAAKGRLRLDLAGQWLGKAERCQLPLECEETELVGVNNRDLKTFTVDIGRSIQLSRRIPAGKLLIAESGISGVQTILQMKEAGFDGFLIGESFMKAEDPGAAFRQFVGELRELKR